MPGAPNGSDRLNQQMDFEGRTTQLRPHTILTPAASVVQCDCRDAGFC
jgi:hypothetical protein